MIGADTTFLVQLEAAELPAHSNALNLLQTEILASKISLALAPQVIAEFLHVITDPRRFSKPLTMDEAMERARYWWNCAEVTQIYPSNVSLTQSLAWIEQHRLGRKRILDTQLAATSYSAGVNTIITSNASDFTVFGFKILTP